MLSEILSNIINIYETYRGDGKILVIFLVSVLFLYLCKADFSVNIFALILSPLMAIGVSFVKIMKKAFGMDAAFKSARAFTRLFAIFLCIFAIMLTGNRIYSKEYISVRDNKYCISEDLKQVMDYILSCDENPKVVAMPDYCMYFPMYSSKFNMMYEQRIGDDIRYLDENSRTVYGQLAGRNPVMYDVSKAAKNAGYEYIVLLNDHYWPEFPLEYYDYEKVNTIGRWDIYVLKEDAYE